MISRSVFQNGAANCHLLPFNRSNFVYPTFKYCLKNGNKKVKDSPHDTQIQPSVMLEAGLLNRTIDLSTPGSSYITRWFEAS
jgi:hypothetical protein